jgi:hypothetical protein
VTDYVARRMVEREHAFVAPPAPAPVKAEKRRHSGFFPFAPGFLLGAAAAVRAGVVCGPAEPLT